MTGSNPAEGIFEKESFMLLLTYQKHQFKDYEYRLALEMVLDLCQFGLNSRSIERAANEYLNTIRLYSYPNVRVLTPCLGKWY